MSGEADSGLRETLRQGRPNFLPPEGRIRDCLAPGVPDTVPFTSQAAANVVAVLSTVGNVVLEKMCKEIGGPD